MGKCDTAGFVRHCTIMIQYVPMPITGMVFVYSVGNPDLQYTHDKPWKSQAYSVDCL